MSQHPFSSQSSSLPSQPFLPPPSSSPWWKQPGFIFACLVCLIIVALSLLSKWSESSSSASKPVLRRIKSVVAQCVRWNSMAQQDTNPLMQLVHCNYALANAQAARLLFSDRDIEQVTGLDIHELVNYLDECQAYAIKNIGQNCPNIKIDGVYTVGSGWN